MITVNRKQLATELALLQSVAEKKGTIPALSYTLFQFSNGVLVLTASDMDTSLTVEIEAAGDEWSGCVPSKQLHDLVKLFYDDVVKFEEKANGRIAIKCGNSKHQLPILPAFDFPVVDRADVSMTEIDGSTLSLAITRALRATSPDTKDLWMQGVSLRSADGSLFVAATNGRNIAMTELVADMQVDVLVPFKAASTLVKLLSDTVEIGANQNLLVMRQGHRLFTARLIDAKFVDWRKVIPQSLEHSLTLDPEAAKQALKLASVTSQESALIPIPLRLTVSRNELLIETAATSKGQSSERLEVNCETLNGDKLERGINGQHFINFFDTDAKVILSFNSGMEMFQLRPENEPNYRYITMSLR